MPKPKSKSSDKVTTVRLPEDWYEELRLKAFNDRISIADLIRDALRDKFKLKDPEPKERRALGAV